MAADNYPIAQAGGKLEPLAPTHWRGLCAQLLARSGSQLVAETWELRL